MSSKVSTILVALSILLAASVPVLPADPSQTIIGSTGLALFLEPCLPQVSSGLSSPASTKPSTLVKTLTTSKLEPTIQKSILHDQSSVPMQKLLVLVHKTGQLPMARLEKEHT